jgi:hypothetical protein
MAISLPEGHIVAIRLGPGNNAVLDYLFLPTSKMTGIKIRFTEAGLSRFDDHLFGTLIQLSKAVLNQLVCRPRMGKNVIKSGRVSRSTPLRSKRETKSRSKAKAGRARR